MRGAHSVRLAVCLPLPHRCCAAALPLPLVQAIIVEECMKTGGIGASLSAVVHESLFNELDHEVRGGGRGGGRCGGRGWRGGAKERGRCGGVERVDRGAGQAATLPHRPAPPTNPLARSCACRPKTCPHRTPTSWRRRPSCSRSRWQLRCARCAARVWPREAGRLALHRQPVLHPLAPGPGRGLGPLPDGPLPPMYSTECIAFR